MNRIGWIAVLALVLPHARAQQTAWTYVPPAGHVDVSPAIGDVNGDGRTDIIVGTTAGFIVAVDDHGKEIWRHQMRDAVCIASTAPNPVVTIVSISGRSCRQCTTTCSPPIPGMSKSVITMS